ncbi:DUF4384 domain-containing protein [Deinococcus pimensis]|uniref:DUF4384 domain-containing protein n=1 Tax=Deinococcus pimensis TaxID=309888 RepID=UPI000485539A|nr:DUF4384 domain-containing protein [Deinococcus pimensis]
MNKIITMGALALLSGALAAPRISAQSIIVNPTPTDLQVRVSTDKDPTGGQVPNYRVGEKIRLSVTANQDAYVYLFNVNPDGSIDQILPNRFASGANFIKANTVKQFPASGDNFTFDISGPSGLNKVLALASKTELNLDQISSFKATGTTTSAADAFATVTVKGQQQLAQALSIVVTPLPQNTWVTDTALYNTVGATTPNRNGSLTVTTNAEDTTVFLNERELGASGTTFANIAPGTYRVRISAPGYADYTTNVTVRAGATVNLNISLQAQRLPLTIRSNVEGALVFIDGRQAGTIKNGAYSTQLARDSYEVVVLAPGYRAGVQQIQVQNGGTVTVNLNRAQ